MLMKEVKSVKEKNDKIVKNTKKKSEKLNTIESKKVELNNSNENEIAKEIGSNLNIKEANKDANVLSILENNISQTSDKEIISKQIISNVETILSKTNYKRFVASDGENWIITRNPKRVKNRDLRGSKNISRGKLADGMHYTISRTPKKKQGPSEIKDNLKEKLKSEDQYINTSDYKINEKYSETKQQSLQNLIQKSVDTYNSNIDKMKSITDKESAEYKSLYAKQGGIQMILRKIADGEMTFKTK